LHATLFQPTKKAKDALKVGHEFSARDIEIEFKICKHCEFMFMDVFSVFVQFVIDRLAKEGSVLRIAMYDTYFQ
jgi:hypothetical protein